MKFPSLVRCHDLKKNIYIYKFNIVTIHIHFREDKDEILAFGFHESQCKSSNCMLISSY